MGYHGVAFNGPVKTDRMSAELVTEIIGKAGDMGFDELEICLCRGNGDYSASCDLVVGTDVDTVLAELEAGRTWFHVNGIGSRADDLFRKDVVPALSGPAFLKETCADYDDESYAVMPDGAVVAEDDVAGKLIDAVFGLAKKYPDDPEVLAAAVAAKLFLDIA